MAFSQIDWVNSIRKSRSKAMGFTDYLKERKRSYSLYLKIGFYHINFDEYSKKNRNIQHHSPLYKRNSLLLQSFYHHSYRNFFHLSNLAVESIIVVVLYADSLMSSSENDFLCIHIQYSTWIASTCCDVYVRSVNIVSL